MSFRQHFSLSLQKSQIAPRRAWIWLPFCLLGACAAAPKPHTEEEGTTPVVAAPEEGGPEEGAVLGSPAGLDLEALAAELSQDPEHVLNQLDDAEAEGAIGSDQLAQFSLLYAEASRELFDQRLAANRLDPALAETLCLDTRERAQAARAAGAAERDCLRLELDSHQRLGESKAAWSKANAMRPLLDNLDAGDPEVAADLLSIGQAGLAWTIAEIQAGSLTPAAARHGATALARAADAGLMAAFVPLSDLAAWQGLTTQAMASLQAGLLLSPENVEFYGRLRPLGDQSREAGIRVLESVQAAHPSNATVLWYLGEALYLQGREARSVGDTLLASSCWDRAEDRFHQAMALREDYQSSCEDWLFLVRTQRGWTLRDEGRIDDAASSLLNTLRQNPERLEPTSAPESLHLAIDAIVADYFRANDLKNARSFLRQVCAVRNDEGNWCNNLGFFCRDLGVMAMEAGDVEQAAELFEESWEAYSRAVELLPEDARVVNDRALIAVYYRDEDHDLAEQELHRAIDLGTAALAEMDENVPESEHEYVDMAVGDAWENLAYLYLVRRGEIGESEHFLRQSVKHFPYEERTGVQRLRIVLAELRKENP